MTAIPEMLKLLSLKGCTATLDALGCLSEIAARNKRLNCTLNPTCLLTVLQTAHVRRAGPGG